VAITDGKVTAWWPVLLSLLICAFTAGALLTRMSTAEADVTTVDAKADEANRKAAKAFEALNDMNVRLARIETKVDRIDRSIK
jgi:hypothetical protein